MFTRRELGELLGTVITFGVPIRGSQKGAVFVGAVLQLKGLTENPYAESLLGDGGAECCVTGHKYAGDFLVIAFDQLPSSLQAAVIESFRQFNDKDGSEANPTPSDAVADISRDLREQMQKDLKNDGEEFKDGWRNLERGGDKDDD